MWIMLQEWLLEVSLDVDTVKKRFVANRPHKAVISDSPDMTDFWYHVQKVPQASTTKCMASTSMLQYSHILAEKEDT